MNQFRLKEKFRPHTEKKKQRDDIYKGLNRWGFLRETYDYIATQLTFIDTCHSLKSRSQSFSKWWAGEQQRLRDKIKFETDKNICIKNKTLDQFNRKLGT